MPNFESGYRSILGAKLNPADSTMTVATPPTVTSGRLYLDNGAQEERIKFTGVSGSTLTGLVRGLSKTADPATAGTGLTWVAGTEIKLVDMHDQLWDESKTETITGAKTFTNATFAGDIEISTIGNLDVNGKSNPQPNFANTTERDALYTSPVNGDKATVAGAEQTYNGYTMQWETFGTSTPVPLATNTVAGMATLLDISSLTTVSDYPLGEPITDITKSCVFKETAPTFAQATTEQNVGDVAGNTRVSFPAIGTGVAGNSLKLALAKAGTPTAFCRVRIETDNAGSPSGTLVDPNATKDIDPATLTTSLADTTVLMGATVANAHGVTLNVNETSQTVYKGVKFTLTQQVGAISVDKVAGCTATKAYLYDLAGNLLTSASFSTNTATLNYNGLVNGTSYYIMAGSDGSSYTSVKQTGASAYPYTAGRLNYVGGSYKGIGANTTSIGNYSGGGPTTGARTFTFTVQKDCYLSSFVPSNSGYDQDIVLSTTVLSVLKNNSGTVLATASDFVGNFTKSAGTLLIAGNTYKIDYMVKMFSGRMSTSAPTGSDINITFVSDSGGGGYINKYSLTTTEAITNITDINNITSISTNDTILIPSVQKVHTVVSAVGDVVNASNYYKIGYRNVDTTTRRASSWNGVSWSIISELVTIDSSGQTLSPTSTEYASRGYRIYTNKASYLTSVTKTASSSATRVRLLADGGTTLATATFVGNIATFTPYLLTTATYYRVEADNNGSNYTFAYNNSSTSFPYAGTNITYNTGSTAGSSAAFACNIASISTTEYTLPFPYISSTLFHNTVLSLTDSDFSYKVTPYGIATALGAIGTYPKLTVFGASDNFTGMTEGGMQYLGPTPGGIQPTAGTNSFVVGKARNSTKLRVKDLIS